MFDDEEEQQEIVVAQATIPQEQDTSLDFLFQGSPIRIEDEAPLQQPEYLQDAMREVQQEEQQQIQRQRPDEVIVEQPTGVTPVASSVDDTVPDLDFLFGGQNLIEDPEYLRAMREAALAQPTQEELMQATQSVQSPASQIIASDRDNGLTYTRGDFLERDDLYDVVQDYLVRRHGVQHEKMSREKNVDSFLSHMRKYSAGQSVVTATELVWITNQIKKDDGEALISANAAYDLFDNMSGVFSKDYTGRERAQAVGTYLRAAIVDPTTLLSVFGAGLIMRGAGKGTAQAVQTVARNAADAAVAKAARGNATTQAQQAIRQQVYQKSLARLATSSGVGQSAAARQAALSSGAFRDKVAYWAAAGAVDASLAVGIDAMYQTGMMRTGRQEDWSKLQTGAAAFMGLAVPAAGAGYEAVRYGLSRPLIRESGIGVATQQDVYRAITRGGLTDLSARQAALMTAEEVAPVADQVALRFTSGLEAMIDNRQVGDWNLSVAKGRAQTEGVTAELELDFWNAALLGEDGLAVALRDAGFGSAGPMGRRYETDKFTNHVADVLKQLPPEVRDNVADKLRQAGGEVFPNYQNMSMDQLANRLTYVTNFAGRTNNIVSQASKIINTPLEIAKDVSDTSTGLAVRAGKDAINKVRYAQDYLIRSIVTHPSTSMLNVKGWAAYEGLYAPTRDAFKVALYGTQAAFDQVVPGRDPMRNLQLAKANFDSFFTRWQNLADPNMSLEAAQAYLSQRPEIRNALGETLYGGVVVRRSPEEAIAQFGFDPNANIYTAKAEDAQKFFQTLWFATGQDMYTKGASFMINMDRLVREEYGVSLRNALRAEDPTTYVATERWKNIEARAVDETLKAVFSKSYHSSVTGRGKYDPIGMAASAAEDVKQVPLAGALMPFGRFFNNTIAFMVESTPAGPLARMAGVAFQEDDFATSVGKAAAGSTIIYFGLVKTEDQYIEAGLNWKQSIADDGAVTSREFEYPYSMWKAGARILAHRERGEAVPEDLAIAFRDQVVLGQFTREFNETTRGISAMFETLITGEEEINYVLMDSFLSFAGNVVAATSGYTRPLDPFNQAIAVARGEDFALPDRNQGYKVLNQALRYVDQPADMLSEMLTGKPLMQPQRVITQRGDLPATPTRVISERAEAPLTNTGWMFNRVGMDDWRQAMRTRDVPEAAARFNEMFFESLEPRAKALRNNDEFANASLARKRLMTQEVIQEARNETKDLLKVSLDYEDRRYELITRLVGSNNNYGRRRVDSTLGMYFNGSDIGDLTMEELERLKFMLDNEEIFTP